MQQYITNCLTAALLGGLSLPLAAQPLVLTQEIPYRGYGVSISGEWAIVGNGDDAENLCEVKIYRYDYITNTWGDGAGNPGVEFQKLPKSTGNNNCNSNKGYGNSVSVDGGTLLVGIPEKGKEGAAQLWDFNGTEWVEIGEVEPALFATLRAPQDDMRFGESVSIRFNASGTSALLVVGAPAYDGTGASSGAVYVFDWDPATLTASLLDTFEADAPAAGGLFGAAVTSNGSEVVIGAPGTNGGEGAAYVFENNGSGVFTQLQKIDGSTTGITTGPGHALGQSVSLRIDQSMLLGGTTSYSLAPSEPGDPSTFAAVDSLATGGGDVSQSLLQVGLGSESSNSVQVFENPADLTSPILDISETDGGTTYGNDISVGNFRVLVNGDGNTTDTVTYAYTIPCGVRPARLPVDRWFMIGIPCQAGSATFADIFAGLTVQLYEQNGTDYSGGQAAYTSVPLSVIPEQGAAYWVRSTTGGEWRIDAPNGLPTPVIADPLNRADIGGVFSLDVTAMATGASSPATDFRIMLSNPFPFDVEWTEAAMQLNGSAPGLISGASYSTYFEAGNSTAYVYSPTLSDYIAISSTTPGLGSQLPAHEGFFVRLSSDFVGLLTSGDTLELLLPAAQ